jgi:protoporphyrinogen oxidase
MLAIEMGVKIISVNKMIGAQYYDVLIKEFVELNNKIREKSSLHKQIGKNNNNTFYGRLGMNPERLEEEIISNIDENKNYEKLIEKNGIYLGYTKKEKNISNVLVSASITSKARIKLYRGMLEVIKHKGRIFYTDTDSIIAGFKENDYKKVIDNKIGEVLFDSKKEDTIIEDAVFAMPKTYALRYKNGEEIVKIKGFNTTPSFEEFKKTFYNKESIITENNE